MYCKKKLIVIGNGNGILDKKNGSLIDSFDYVVRMGSCQVAGYEEYVGTRTDLYRSSWDRMFELIEGVLYPIKNNIRSNNFLFLEPDYDVFSETIADANNINLKKLFYKKKFVEHRFYNLLSCNIPQRILHDFFLRIINILYCSNNIFYMTIKQRIDIFKKLNNTIQFKEAFLPSGGLCTLLFVLETFKDYSIWITGFDGFQTKYYWRSTDVSFKVHSSLHENLFLKELTKNKIITVL